MVGFTVSSLKCGTICIEAVYAFNRLVQKDYLSQLAQNVLLIIIQNCTKHYNYLQAYLYEIQAYTNKHNQIYKYQC